METLFDACVVGGSEGESVGNFVGGSVGGLTGCSVGGFVVTTFLLLLGLLMLPLFLFC